MGRIFKRLDSRYSNVVICITGFPLERKNLHLPKPAIRKNKVVQMRTVFPLD